MGNIRKNLRATLYCFVATFAFTLVANISSAANYFWVNGTGNWSNNSNHWATTSGGSVFHITPPGLHDNVFFDANSFLSPGDTVYDNVLTTSCNTMNWTGVQNSPVFYFSYIPPTLFQNFNPFDYNFRIYGSLILSQNMTWNFSGSVGFVSNLSGNTILSDGTPINSDLTFDNPNGGWFLTDSLETQTINISNGSFNTNNQFVKCYTFNTSSYLGVTYLNLGASEIRCTHSWTYQGDADKISAVNSTISFEGSSPFADYFNSTDSVAYNDVIFYDDGTLSYSDSIHIKKMIFNKRAVLGYLNNTLIDTLIFNNPGYSVDFEQNLAIIGSHTEINGTCNGIVTVAGGNFYQLTGTATFNYCKFDRGIYATGGASFTANNSSQNPAAPTTGVNFITTPVTDMYWVGNNGNWNDPAHWSATSGGAGGSCLPTQFTNVHVDANSFSSPGQTITVDSAAKIYCRNLDWANSQAGSKLFCVDTLSAFLFIYGNLSLTTAINFDFRGNVLLKSLTAGNSITTGNNFLNCESFVQEGFNGNYLLNDSLNVKGQIGIVAGAFQTNGNYISCRFLKSADFGSMDLSTSVVKVNDGLSVISVSGGNSKIYIQGNTNNTTTFYGFFSTFGLLESFADVSMSSIWGISFDKLILHGNSTIANAITVDSLIFNAPGKSLILTSDTTVSYNINHFIANGNCNSLINISGTGYQYIIAPIGITQAQISYAYLSNLVINNNLTATNSINGGGLSNITVVPSPAQNFYWVGGSGSWDDNTHWSNTSGGSAGSCLPSQIDNVFFDANSFSSTGQTVYVPQHPYQGCASMSWTGAAFNPSFLFDTTIYSSDFYINGSLTLIPQMNWIPKSNLHFGKSNSLKTITTAGHVLGISNTYIFINCDSLAGYSLADSLVTDGLISFEAGKFNSANQKITTYFFNISNNTSYNPPRVYLGNSTVSTTWTEIKNYYSFPVLFSGNAFFKSENFNMHDSQCTIGTLNVNNYSGEDNYGHFKKLIINKDASLSNSNGLVIDTLLLQNPEHTLRIQDSIRINNYLGITGDAGCQKYCTITTPTFQAGQSDLIVPSGTVIADYVALNSINATGGAFFTANHCLDLGNNTGWSIVTAVTTTKDYYWIGGGGNWNDDQHWSLTSGGGTSGCIPSRYDNVHFDANSFSVSGDTVLLNQGKVYCNDMDWTGVQFNPTFANQQYFELLTIGGSLILSPNMNFRLDRAFEFTANDSDNVIHLVGTSLQSDYSLNQFIFSGAGLWQLTDSLSLGDYYLTLNGGTLQSNNNLIRSDLMQSGFIPGNKVHLDLGSSDVYGSFYCADSSQVDLNAMNAKFYASGFGGGNYQQYDYVETSTFYDSCHINKVVCKALQVYLPQYSNVDSLIFDNSVALCDVYYDSVFVTGKWIINNDLYHPIRFQTINNGITGTIVKTSDTLCFDNLFLKDVHITGGVTAYAGYNSIDKGNNDGWIFGSCAMPIDSVWPGDANYDLVANNIDVLNIGVAYGETGPVRNNPNTSWTPQAASDWSKNFYSGFNYKHADCNGDGVVDNTDTAAINLNYGSTHPFRLAGISPQINSAPLLYLVSSVDTAGLSQAVNIDIFLGTATMPVDSIYGIAFTINFNPALVDTNSITFDYTGSWLGTAGTDLFTYEKVFAPTGYADLALVRTDHFNSSGFGYIGRMGVVVVDNVTGRIVLPFSVSNITAITYGQTLLEFNTTSDSVDIDTTQTVSINTLNPENEIHIFPVPARDNLYIYSNINLPMEKIELVSLYGEIVYSSSAISTKQVVNTSKISNGIYLLKCYTKQGLVCKKVEIVHR